ncbi:hypothetical protein [Paenibacillus shenyangensis]|uniref:hypothetical protein n=1 Tax=Paenibacillus sp. A9 TaxID=1284352 RepID=UPI00036283C3|nr:hypothetical protein [Paenibacillus sp. A9]
MNGNDFGPVGEPHQAPPGYRPSPGGYDPLHRPDQQPGRDRFVLALTSFILSIVGLISMTSVTFALILLIVGNAEFGVMPVLSMIGLIVSFVIIILSLVFSILSLRSSRGRGFAIASLTIGLLQIVSWAGFFGLMFWIDSIS